MPSSVIRHFRYLPERTALEVTFVSGRRYLYHDVPEATVREMREAFSKGAYFNRHIRDHYACSRIAEAG